VVIIELAVDRVVHGHRRHHDAIAQRDAFEREGTEQIRHDVFSWLRIGNMALSL
jgi:hypothetical protein